MPVIPKIPIGDLIETIVEWATSNLSIIFDALSVIIDFLVSALVSSIMFFHPLVAIIISLILVWFIANKKTAIGTALGLLLAYNLQLWAPSVETFSLVISATLLALLVGIPLGILSARSDVIHQIVMPIMDFMQTMPPFVYLIPAVFFFGVGNVPGLIATIIFAMPPAIRLTGLGIRQVPEELVEAADAFGSTPGQKLVKVQLPVALPTIMAGVNQVIMLSLSMVVISAMIGAGGLGAIVLRGIQRLDVGMGFEGGLAIVITAMILDRITQSITERRKAKI
ncbi:MAG: proline/glycine betaine ABC transporter permease [Clostridiales bacterium]|nr:proline/glycine betaine ABC transporter permease [Clostridiales bacterium]MCF8022560.1 proline/glycine betaine ABC transporter permease [Clostridiales bacterium]